MTTPKATRTLIRVTNNQDEGKGSLRDAIRLGNEAVNKGNAVEIVFTSSLHIKAKSSYVLEKGDWLFNERLTKNIIVDGKEATGPLFQIGTLSKIEQSTKSIDVDDLKVDITRMHLVNSHVKGSDGQRGGGGGMGAGSALLHFNGHVTWRDSSFQGNTVEGGRGAIGAKGGQAFYIHDKDNSQNEHDGEKGERGGNFNGSKATSNSGDFGTAGQRGEANVVFGYHTKEGRGLAGGNGHKGHSGKFFGEAGGGGGGGGGGTYQQRARTSRDDYYPVIEGYQDDGSKWGNGGRGGDGGDGSFGAGGGAGGSAGANAGNNRYWGNTFFLFGKWYERSPDWSTKNKQGKNGRSGEWASAATSAGDPNRGNPGTPGRGGDGAALGIISSFANKSEKSSLSFENIDFRKNTAKGGDKTGRFSNIYSRHLEIKYSNVTNSTGDTFRGSEIGTGSFSRNTNSVNTDKSKSYFNSGNFQQQTINQNNAPREIWSMSYENRPSIVQTFGKSYTLNNEQGHVIVLHADHDDHAVQNMEIEGAEALLSSVRDINQAANRTKDKDEILKSHKGIFGSVSKGFVANKALAFGGQWAMQQATTEWEKYKSTLTPEKVTQLTNTGMKVGAALGIAGFVGETIFNQIMEDARIEKELEQKNKIDKEKNRINALIPQKLNIQPVDIGQNRTYDTFKNFQLGRDQMIFSSRITPNLEYRIDPARGGVLNIYSERTDGANDNSARLIGQIQLTKSQTESAKRIGNNTQYFQDFLHIVETKAGKGRYVLAKDSQWQYYSRPSDRIPGGIGNDRIIVQREEGISKTTMLKVNGFEGDDRIKGDDGNSLLIGESGNDFFDPGLGSDIIRGGSGVDTASYTSLKSGVSVKTNSKGDIIVSDSSDSLKWSDQLIDVEAIRTWGESKIDLSGARKTSNQGGGFLIQTGANGSIEGSRNDDIIITSFASNFNSKPRSILNGKSTYVDGKQGRNQLLIDGLSAHIKDGNKIKLQFTNNEKTSGKIISLTKTKGVVMRFKNITNGIHFTDASQTQNGLLSPLQNKTTNETLDTLTGDSMDSTLSDKTSSPNRNLDRLTGNISDNIFRDANSSQPSIIKDPKSHTLEPINLPLEPMTNSEESATFFSAFSPCSTRSAGWEGETQAQPMLMNNEFFIDPLT